MKAIYKPRGRAGEYAKYACNFYTGCSNDCEYCYCKRGVMSHVWDNKPHLRKCFISDNHAISCFCYDIFHHFDELRDGGVFFSFTTDPCLPETVNNTLFALACATAYGEGVPCTVLTKCVSSLFEEALQLLCYNGLGSKVAVGFTLTGHDELEPNASPNSERIAAMKRIHEMGIKTFASIEPIIDIAGAKSMIDQTLDFCDLYRIGLRSGVRKCYYDDNELKDFLASLQYLDAKIYLKDSFLERINVARDSLDGSKFVNADYNIFNTERYD